MIISRDSKYLCVFLSNYNIKIISLANLKIVNEISSVPLNSLIYRTSLFNINSQYILFYSPEECLINFYSVSKNSFPFYLKVKEKNFFSQTENEKQNLKKLKLVTASSPIEDKNTKEQINYLMTVEEYSLEKEFKMNLSYIKFWKASENDIDLICLAENPHLNERITKIKGGKNKFISIGEYGFKIWNKEKENEKFICSFEGKYKGLKINDCSFGNDNIIYALFKNYLIKYKGRFIENIYAFTKFIPEELNILTLDNSNLLCLYNENNLIIFNTEHWKICWTEKVSLESGLTINKVIQLNKELNVLLKNSKDIYYCIKYSVNEEKKIVDNSFVLEKKDLIYVDIFKKYYIAINNKMDIFLTGNLKKENPPKNKKSLDRMDIETEIKEGKSKHKKNNIDTMAEEAEEVGSEEIVNEDNLEEEEMEGEE
ncbi:MAG: hypothetical protein MJ252_10925 [archaeon]|nr:hypothetical protein [archaeon]